MDFRIGNGYDAHRFAAGRKLFLGCVHVPYAFGLLGHSDADVLAHALADAMLGACALGDIGVHFPDSDPSLAGVSGEFILKKTLEICEKAGFRPVNVDSVIVAQEPKLASFLPLMKEKISSALSLSPSCVNVKATTEEKMGFTGRLEGISAHAVCLMEAV